MKTASQKPQLVFSRLLIDGTGREPLEQGAILIRDRKIAAVGTRQDFAGIADADMLDCSDQVLAPGLIDAHNHLSLDSSIDDYLQHMQDPLPVLTIRALQTMKADIKGGVTTLRCLGDKGYLDMACRDAVASGTVEGPRLINAGMGIRAASGHGYVGYPFNGAEEMCTTAQENVRRGADLVKFYATGTLPGGKGEAIHCFLTREEIFALAAEAQQLGKPTAVHCTGGNGFDWCLEAGIDSIEHGYFLTDEQIRNLRDSEAWLVLTPGFYLSEKRIRALPPALVEPHLEAQALARETMAQAISTGVRYAVGTDGAHGMGAMAEEAAYLVELGASNADALAAATFWGAELCRVDHITGTLEVGKEADIIGLRQNPLDDIQTLADVRTVISRGRVVKMSK